MKVKRYFLYLAVVMLVSSCGRSESGKNTEDSSAAEVTETLVENVQSTDSVSIDSNDETITEGSSKVSIPHDGRASLLDFTASWCPPCQRMKPIIEELTDTYDEMINFVVIDIDDNEDLASQYAIQAVPTYIFLDRNGKVVKRVEGAVEQEVLENQINIMITK